MSGAAGRSRHAATKHHGRDWNYEGEKQSIHSRTVILAPAGPGPGHGEGEQGGYAVKVSSDSDEKNRRVTLRPSKDQNGKHTRGHSEGIEDRGNHANQSSRPAHKRDSKDRAHRQNGQRSGRCDGTPDDHDHQWARHGRNSRPTPKTGRGHSSHSESAKQRTNNQSRRRDSRGTDRRTSHRHRRPPHRSRHGGSRGRAEACRSRSRSGSWAGRPSENRNIDRGPAVAEVEKPSRQNDGIRSTPAPSSQARRASSRWRQRRRGHSPSSVGSAVPKGKRMAEPDEELGPGDAVERRAKRHKHAEEMHRGSLANVEHRGVAHAEGERRREQQRHRSLDNFWRKGQEGPGGAESDSRVVHAREGVPTNLRREQPENAQVDRAVPNGTQERLGTVLWPPGPAGDPDMLSDRRTMPGAADPSPDTRADARGFCPNPPSEAEPGLLPQPEENPALRPEKRKRRRRSRRRRRQDSKGHVELATAAVPEEAQTHAASPLALPPGSDPQEGSVVPQQAEQPDAPIRTETPSAEHPLEATWPQTFTRSETLGATETSGNPITSVPFPGAGPSAENAEEVVKLGGPPQAAPSASASTSSSSHSSGSSSRSRSSDSGGSFSEGTFSEGGSSSSSSSSSTSGSGSAAARGHHYAQPDYYQGVAGYAPGRGLSPPPGDFQARQQALQQRHLMQQAPQHGIPGPGPASFRSPQPGLLPPMQRPPAAAFGFAHMPPGMPLSPPMAFVPGYGMPMYPLLPGMPPHPDMMLGYGQLPPDSPDGKGKGKGRGRKRRRRGSRSQRRRRPRLGEPPEKVGETWELGREEKGLQLISELAPPGVNWEYRLQDESRRCYSAFLDSPVGRHHLRAFFEKIRTGTQWTQPMSALGIIPRKTAWMVRPGCSCNYRYGGIEVQPQAFPDWMQELLTIYMPYCGFPNPADWPNSCNVNLYENGSQSVGWHADDEALFQGLFQDIRILSLSLGQRRKFDLRKNWPEEDEKTAFRIMLGNGCMCTMEGMFQKHYQHRVPKESEDLGPRINLTWRWILKHSKVCPLSCS